MQTSSASVPTTKCPQTRHSHMVRPLFAHASCISTLCSKFRQRSSCAFRSHQHGRISQPSQEILLFQPLTIRGARRVYLFRACLSPEKASFIFFPPSSGNLPLHKKTACSNQLDLRSFATRCIYIISIFFAFVKGHFLQKYCIIHTFIRTFFQAHT